MESSCQRFQMLLSAYVDGEVEGRDRGHVETHLSGCADCRARVEDLKALQFAIPESLLREADEVDFSGFADRVLRQVTPDRPSFLERLRIGWTELLDHHRLAVFSSLAAAGVALLIAVPVTWWAARGGEPARIAANEQPPVIIQDLRLADPNVQPVVLRGENGQIMIMLVDRPGASQPQQFNTTPPTGGEL